MVAAGGYGGAQSNTNFEMWVETLVGKGEKYWKYIRLKYWIKLPSRYPWRMICTRALHHKYVPYDSYTYVCAVGETGCNSNTFCFGGSGTETIWDIRLLFTCVQTLVIWLNCSCKHIWKYQHQVVEIRLRKKMITDVTINPGCEVNCNRSPGNCNILKNNVMISTVIKKT